jgi:hypothetical protein
VALGLLEAVLTLDGDVQREVALVVDERKAWS